MWQPCRLLVTPFMMYDPETPPLAPSHQIVCANGFVRWWRDDSPCSPQLSWSACRCHQPGILASVPIATNLSHCHDGNILSQVNYRELTDPEEKSTRILLVGVLELNMVLSIIYFVIQIYQYSNILFILEPLPLLYICNAIPPLCKGLD